MWVFTQDGFMSVVEHRDDQECLIVRARARQDLETLAKFGGVDVIVMPEADYYFRVEVTRTVFAAFMREQVLDIDYPNFKGRLHERNRSPEAIEREQFAYRIWAAGCDYQRQIELLGSEVAREIDLISNTS